MYSIKYIEHMNQSNKLRYIMYCRKSTDSEDRQVQSIDDQKKELERLVKERGLNVVHVFTESKSAKKPGRPEYNQMMQMIKNGQADGVLCWKLNRLARNPIDGGEIQWLLQQNVIQSITTHSREYLPTDNVLMMAVELGMANQFLLDLSKDVKRGMKAKAEKGWRPHKAPIGYLNEKGGDKGMKRILTDPERFPIIRKMWDFFLTGNYTAAEINRIATDKWGLVGFNGKALALSSVYKIFTNPFYYGEFEYGGEVYQGKHKPMITVDEFDTVQSILGAAGKPRPKSKRLPFTGIVHCGECGAMITADEKRKKLKSTGEYKKYLYHKCTKHKRGKKCTQKPITHKKFVKQINDALDEITIPDAFLEWAVHILKEQNIIEESDRNAIIKSLHKKHQAILKRIDNLINMYITPENQNRDLLTEKEYKSQKTALMKEKQQIEDEIRSTETRVDDWVSAAEQAFEFACNAKRLLAEGDAEQKSRVLRALGQNFIFKDGKLDIQMKKEFEVIREDMKSPELQKVRFEPALLGANPIGAMKNSLVQAAFSRMHPYGESNPGCRNENPES